MENGANAKRSSVSKLFALGLGIVLLVGGAWPASLGFADGRQSQTNELDSPTDVMAEGERVASSKEPVETDSSEVEGSMPGALDVDAGPSVDPDIDQSTSPENAEEKVGEGEMTLGGDAAETAALAEPLAPVQSYAGADMFETAAAEAKAAYPEGSASAILVGPGGSWVDALSAAGLAASRGPILFTERGYLPEATAEALAELKAKSVVIVGGEAAVKPGVVDDLASMGISLEKRLYGADCYDTQMAVYEYGLDNGLWDASMAIVATASGFGDALSVSPVAFAKRAPIFLVEAGGMLRGAQQQALVEGACEGRFSHVVSVGGSAVISEETFGFLEFVAAAASPSGSCERVAGADQYATSAAVANWAVNQGILSWDNAAFSSGALPYDALAGSVLQGKSKSVLLLVGDAESATIGTAVGHAGSIRDIRYFGGTGVIPSKLRSYIEYSFQFGYALPMGATKLSDGSYLWCNASGVDRDDAIRRVMSIARSCLGIPYVWLGKYPEDGGMDCASFTWHVYTRKLGMEIGFETYNQMFAGYRVGSLSEAKPGDLILMYYGSWPNYNWNLPEHVVLYAGDGMVYEEPDFGKRCQYVSLASKGAGKIEIRRIVHD